MVCIFCDKDNNATSIEHIVPESFGNTFYTLTKGKVCDECNSRFSNFERKALSNSIFAIERAKFGVATKKGKSVNAKVKELIIEGDKKFRKSLVKIKGLDDTNTKNYNPKDRTFQVLIPTFDKSEVATSKLLLKIGLESISISQKKLFKKYSFQDLKNYLTTKINKDWPFINNNKELEKFNSITKFYLKHQLNKIHCKLKYLEVDENTLLFKFEYGDISMMINLLNRNLGWIKEKVNKDDSSSIYPEHYRNKIKT